MRTSPTRWRHVFEIEAAKMEHDGVAFVEQIPIRCHHASAPVYTEALTMSERFSTEPGISEINKMVERRPIKNDDFFIVSLHWTC